MSSLLELAERCELATGPDRLADQAIGWLVGTQRWRASPVTQYDGPHYTSSLDAAMTLVPEGWDWTTQTSFRKSRARANCDLTQEAPFKPEDWKVTTARAATPALALCAAALRARDNQSR